MKKGILIALMLLVAQPTSLVGAQEPAVTLLLTGGFERNLIRISLSTDGRDYMIDSNAALEVGGDLCTHPLDDPTELSCEAPAIAAFELNLEGGADVLVLSPDISIPATIRGGVNDDRLIGGGAADKILGGPGNDVLGGRRGDDWLFGGPDDDRLIGGQGDDQLRGGPGTDAINGGPGSNYILARPGLR